MMVALGVLGGTTTQADELITNGDFEAGYTGWSIEPYGTGGAGWYLNYWAYWRDDQNPSFYPPLAYPTGPIPPFDNPYGPVAPIDGAVDIVTDKSNPLGGPPFTLARVIHVPQVVESATLSWSHQIRSINFEKLYNDPELGNFVRAWWGGFFHGVRVVLYDGASGGLITELFATHEDDPEVQAVQAVSIPNVTTADGTFELKDFLQSRAGQDLILSFEVDALLGYLNYSLDNVSLVVNGLSGGDNEFVSLGDLETDIANEVIVGGPYDGYTIQEAIGMVQTENEGLPNGKFVDAIAELTNYLKSEGYVTGQQKGLIQSWAAKQHKS